MPLAGGPLRTRIGPSQPHHSVLPFPCRTLAGAPSCVGRYPPPSLVSHLGSRLRFPFGVSCFSGFLLGGIPQCSIPLLLQVQGRHDVGIARPATMHAPESAWVAASIRREPRAEMATLRASSTGPGRVPFHHEDSMTQSARCCTCSSTLPRSQPERSRLVRRLHDTPRSGRYARKCSKTNTCRPAMPTSRWPLPLARQRRNRVQRCTAQDPYGCARPGRAAQSVSAYGRLSAAPSPVSRSPERVRWFGRLGSAPLPMRLPRQSPH